jgi:hypothetical protein
MVGVFEVSPPSFRSANARQFHSTGVLMMVEIFLGNIVWFSWCGFVWVVASVFDRFLHHFENVGQTKVALL